MNPLEAADQLIINIMKNLELNIALENYPELSK